MPAPTDVHVALALQLVHVHDGLRALLGDVADQARIAALDPLAGDARRAAGWLLGHHDMEDQVLFPALRGASGLRSTDAAFLDARVAEHRLIHAACTALQGHAGAPIDSAAWRADLERHTRDLLAALHPHLAAEEAVLTPDHLAEMIGADELAALRHPAAGEGRS